MSLDCTSLLMVPLQQRSKVVLMPADKRGLNDPRLDTLLSNASGILGAQSPKSSELAPQN